MADRVALLAYRLRLVYLKSKEQRWLAVAREAMVYADEQVARYEKALEAVTRKKPL